MVPMVVLVVLVLEVVGAVLQEQVLVSAERAEKGEMDMLLLQRGKTSVSTGEK
jgi:hypothetical protein